MRVIVWVDDAEADGECSTAHGGARYFGAGEGGAEVGDIPAMAGGGAGDQGGAQFMELSGGRGDHEFRRTACLSVGSAGEEEDFFDDRAGGMFFRDRDFAKGPGVSDSFDERNDKIGCEAREPEGNGRRIQGATQGGGVEFDDAGPSFVEKSVGGGFLGRLRGLGTCRR